jgi:hypothetical protein
MYFHVHYVVLITQRLRCKIRLKIIARVVGMMILSL